MPIDIKLTSDKELFVDPNTGDIAFADNFEAVQREMELIILASEGQFPHAPRLGVGAVEYVNAKQTPDFRTKLESKIRTMAQADGKVIVSITWDATTNIPTVTVRRSTD